MHERIYITFMLIKQIQALDRRCPVYKEVFAVLLDNEKQHLKFDYRITTIPREQQCQVFRS